MPQRILFVEDNQNTAKAMKVMLELKGFAVDTAGSVAEAVGKIDEGEYDVVISDIGLPDGTGHDILKRSPKSVTAIALSGYTSEADKQESLSRGFSDYVTKPFKIDDLLAAIKRVGGSDVI